MQYKIEVSKGESLLLDRRSNGLTQAQVGDQFNISKSTYVKRELETFVKGAETNRTRVVSAGEFCMLMRRRAGLKQVELATKMQLSRNSIHSMESETFNPRKLIAYWLKKVNKNVQIEKVAEAL